MKLANAVIVCLMLSSAVLATETIDDIINTKCSTSGSFGLNQQIFAMMDSLPELQSQERATGRIDNIPGVTLNDKAVATVLQAPAADALRSAMTKPGAPSITINSSWRSPVQQFILYEWAQKGRCGIPIAARPGTSNHETGLAIDIRNGPSHETFLENNGFRWLGNRDPPHYDYVGSNADSRYKMLAIKAFQMLWNKHNPTETIDEDGLWGGQSERAARRSPAVGWPERKDDDVDTGDDGNDDRPTFDCVFQVSSFMASRLGNYGCAERVEGSHWVIGTWLDMDSSTTRLFLETVGVDRSSIRKSSTFCLTSTQKSDLRRLSTAYFLGQAKKGYDDLDHQCCTTQALLTYLAHDMTPTSINTIPGLVAALDDNDYARVARSIRSSSYYANNEYQADLESVVDVTEKGCPNNVNANGQSAEDGICGREASGATTLGVSAAAALAVGALALLH